MWNASERKQLRIVADAKFYSSILGHETILKTVDDVKLRADDNYDARGLLICSEGTDLEDWTYLEGALEDEISLVKLQPGNDEDCLRECFYVSSSADLVADDILKEYITKENLNRIKHALMKLIQRHRVFREQ